MTKAERESLERAACLACIEQRCHTEQEWKNHPFRGHGFSDGHWSHPELEREHHEEIACRKQDVL